MTGYDIQCLENFMRNIEIERGKLGLSQKDMSEKIGMSLSSYKRMLNGDMNLKASLVIRDLYLLTGMCCSEFMGFEDDKLRIANKVRKLDEDQREAVEHIVDIMLKDRSK